MAKSKKRAEKSNKEKTKAKRKTKREDIKAEGKKTFNFSYKWFVENYKKSIAISIFLLLLAISVIGYHYYKTGSIFDKGMDFTGGSQAVVMVTSDFNVNYVERIAASIIKGDVRVRKAKGGGSEMLIIESSSQLNENIVKQVLEKAGISYKAINIESISPAISQVFWEKALRAIIIAFIGMGIVVFLTFRSMAPSLAIVLAAASDITTAIALMDVFHIQMSLATLSAILILIGYSVDTDILLSTRVLKRRLEGNLDERIINSAKTGLTMTITAIIVMLVMYILTPSETLKSIALVIMFGLFADIPFTWLQNMAIIKWYVLKKMKKVSKR